MVKKSSQASSYSHLLWGSESNLQKDEFCYVQNQEGDVRKMLG